MMKNQIVSKAFSRGKWGVCDKHAHAHAHTVSGRGRERGRSSAMLPFITLHHLLLFQVFIDLADARKCVLELESSILFVLSKTTPIHINIDIKNTCTFIDYQSFLSSSPLPHS